MGAAAAEFKTYGGIMAQHYSAARHTIPPHSVQNAFSVRKLFSHALDRASFLAARSERKKLMIGKAGILAIALLAPGVAFAAAPAADTAAHATVDAGAKADSVKADSKADVKAEAAKPAKVVKTAKAKTAKAKAKAAPAVEKKTDSEKKTESKS
jgi:hypothetical protein